eukprot:Skav224998  [mRNA]  locus=scaffold765:88096:89665:+ [translate_table: standard]
MLDVLIEGTPRHPDDGALECMAMNQLQVIDAHGQSLHQACTSDTIDACEKCPETQPSQCITPDRCCPSMPIDKVRSIGIGSPLSWREIPEHFLLQDVFDSGISCPWCLPCHDSLDTAASDRPDLQDLEPEGNLDLLSSEPKTLELLSLADLVPEPVRVTVDVRRPRFLWHQVISGSWHSPCLDWRQFQWHPATTQMLQSIDVWNGQPASSFQLYTDGSFCKTTQTAYAAVVLLALVEDRWRFGGFRVFRVWKPLSSLRAERAAILGALVWAIQLSQQQRDLAASFEFCFDSTVAGYTTSGMWTAHSDSSLVSVMLSLTQCLQARHTCFWTHVSGHSGHAWTEAADFACQFGREARVHLHDLEPVFDLLTFDLQDERSHQWMWIFAQDDQFWTPHLHGDQLKFNIAWPTSTVPDVSTLSLAVPRADHVRSVETTARITCLSANVMTLFPAGDRAGTFHPARAEFLATQFEEVDAFVDITEFSFGSDEDSTQILE